jgi:hypothetical protein
MMGTSLPVLTGRRDVFPRGGNRPAPASCNPRTRWFRRTVGRGNQGLRSIRKSSREMTGQSRNPLAPTAQNACILRSGQVSRQPNLTEVGVRLKGDPDQRDSRVRFFASASF